MSPRFPRSSLSDQRRWEDESSLTPEEGEREEGGYYEDVGLGDESAGGGRFPQQQQQQQQPGAQKKRGFFFGKFGSDSGNGGVGGNASVTGSGVEETGTAMSRFLPATLGGSPRRREMSGGVGAEMGAMPAVGLGVRQAQEVEV